jgi:ABC-type sugar transport system permease subunit
VVALGVLFRILMDPEVGFFNRVLTGLGLPALQWLSSSDTALATLVGIGAWKSIGLFVVILTAGMLNIPGDVYDAARVDGAGRWQVFRKVTLPLLMPTLALVLVLITIGSLQEYTLPTVVTGQPGYQGGPGESTLLYNMVIYEEAFTYVRFGTASAAAILEFIVILGISLVWLRLLRSRY